MEVTFEPLELYMMQLFVVIINFSTLVTFNFTPKRLRIKILMPNGPYPIMRESQYPVKFSQISLKFFI